MSHKSHKLQMSNVTLTEQETFTETGRMWHWCCELNSRGKTATKTLGKSNFY